MKGRTHLAFAFLISLICVIFLINLEFLKESIFVLIFTFSSLIPDIDHPGSKLGKKVWPFSFLFKIFIGHRSLMHSLIMPIFLFLIILKFSILYSIAFFGGYLSHLLLDSLNYSGIRWFYPLKIKIKGCFKSGGLFDNLFFVLFFLSSISIIFFLLFFKLNLKLRFA